MSDDEQKTDEPKPYKFGEKVNLETPPEEILARTDEARKDIWLAIFLQLNRSQRYMKFVDANFDIQQLIDQASNTIEVRVIEKPTAVGPPLAPAQLAKMATLLQSSGCTRPRETLQALLKVLAQEDDGPKIIPATAQEAAEIAKQEQLKKKLD